MSEPQYDSTHMDNFYLVEEKRALQKQRDQLRTALIGLVGVSTREELEELEAMMRIMPAPAKDKAATIDAIHALLDTL